ncbi:MAG: cell division transport system ATP-binding protein [Pseudoalteromonas rhizosphaerae]|jgi:cell division transport system ATP-binding protein|uniref:Cell division ATP-binding protein FtsE n=4 Tax=root TaxID=1 RepID=A0ABY3FH04_9GAMM|nr:MULTISPECIES: cell division ATP-binding protein FtsE [Pseudoalteromonas]MBB1293791.1 cell division ATP-binding protein FtsE [Pseudoalteromonas sp. SR41-4]MBB1309654.1 cell division ATP-binding protein FtsE [Pseudoalteromonas sp. SR41-8]MBB1341741.1 cell division ATP-binding protein FtsE [Pseudoalteromonas sp. SR45-6]MBB1396991.1 cell division ATP-binding protein FtsE [Pseudoalteromonas sp. SG44-8]MBB1408484.1 cell division ATP-binding protein FtsE [Pseudoalteromonas sp. SG44-17]|tara:strand:+ start:1596 stop:2273 length:678 start_codon:yes stop_codon:yes gene_type:complete
MINFQQVSKTYPGGHRALEKVNFHVKPGELAFLTGHSGAGKSTLLKLISLMERPSAGHVFINGVDLNAVKSRQIPYVRRDIGIIFQNHRLLERHTIFDNVALPLIIEGTHHKQIEKRVHGALDKVGLLDKVKCHPSTLSGGEQQRVGIARAIVNSPPLLLADEPTGNLDPELSMDILRLFEEFNNHGTTVLIATHDLGLISRMKYRSLTLKDGRMSQDPLAEATL